MFERDPVTTIFVILTIALLILGIWLYRNRTKDSRQPDILDYEGYYRIALTPVGYSVTSQNNLFRTMDTFYYLRKDPFDTEIIIDRVEGTDGKSYRAHAIITSVLPEDRIDSVCRYYFSGVRMTSDRTDIMTISKQNKSAAEILYGINKNSDINSAEFLVRNLNNKSVSGFSPDAYKRSDNARSKTNCDAEIDMDLTIAFSSALKKLIAEKGGTATEEEIKKLFLGQAMLSAMNYGHAVTEIPVFSIMENNE